MSYSAKTYLQQVGLVKLGFPVGDIDGIPGDKTRSAYNKFLASKSKGKSPSNQSVKPPTPWGKIKAFGAHGIKGGYTPPMAKVNVPWRMFMEWDASKEVKTISCHRLIAKPLQEFLNDLYALLGDEGIKEYGFHLWAGCYNPRKSRGGSTMSDHAWAIANDWNPDANGNKQKWTPDKAMKNGTKQFSKAIVALAKKHGFSVGFKQRDGSRRDMMHFSYVTR